jgi:hypothetical protein
MGGFGSGRPVNAERRHRAAELWAQGYSLEEIGWQLGITKQGAQYLLRAAGPVNPIRSIPCPSCGTPASPDRRYARCATCVAADPTATFGERLRAFRLTARLTRLELALRAGLADPSSVSRYEADLSRPRARTLAALVHILGPTLLRRAPEGEEIGAAHGASYCHEMAMS